MNISQHMNSPPRLITLFIGCCFAIVCSYGFVMKAMELLAFVTKNHSVWARIQPEDWTARQSFVQEVNNGPRRNSQKRISIGTLNGQISMIISSPGQDEFKGWIKPSKQQLENISEGPYPTSTVYVYSQNPVVELSLSLIGLFLFGLAGLYLSHWAIRKVDHR
jgi:hypothetical protein